MPRLPDVQSLGPRPSADPRLPVLAPPPNIIDAASDASIQTAAGGYVQQEIADPILRREDAIGRIEAESAFNDRANELYQAELTTNGFKSKEDVLRLRKSLDAIEQETLGSHKGSANSRAALQERLMGRRSDLLAKAANDVITARDAVAMDAGRRQFGAITDALTQDPTALPSAFADINRVVDDLAPAMTPEQEIEMRALFQSQAAAVAVESLLADGDAKGAADILATPGVAEVLDPQQQRAFSYQLRSIKRAEDDRRAERQRRLEDAAAGLGVPVDQLPAWARMQAFGLTPPSAPKAQSAAGQVLQDRELFVRQFGADSEQVAAFDALTTAKAEPPSLSDVSGIRKEFTNLAKDFVQIRDAYNRVEMAAGNPSAASDMALIFNFMKMLDPGSVVREGEFANAQNAAGVPDRVRNTWNRLMSGERLGEDQREDFIGQSRGLYQAQLVTHRRLEQQFKGIAERAGVAPDQVIVDFVGEEIAPGGTQATDGSAGSGAPSAAGRPIIEYDLEGNPVAAASEPTPAAAGSAEPPRGRRASGGADGQIDPGIIDEIAAFAEATPDAGQYFEQMAEILDAADEAGREMTLEEAFEQAKRGAGGG